VKIHGRSAGRETGTPPDPTITTPHIFAIRPSTKPGAIQHTRHGDKYVTVIIDLTPVRDGTGPARLLDMVPGRSKQVFKAWLAERPQTWNDGIETAAMDGFTGFKTAAAEELPAAVAVMDSFHVVRLAGDALDQCHRRVQ